MAVYIACGADHRPRATTRNSILYTSIAFAAVGLALLAVTGLTLLASFTLLLFSSPLLLLFSPVLLLAGFVLAGSATGFSAAGAAALAGVWSFNWALRSLGLKVGLEGVGRVGKTLTKSRQRVEEEEMDFGGYSRRRVVVHPLENGMIEGK